MVTVLIVLVTALIAGGAVYFWQSSVQKTENADLANEVEELKSQLVSLRSQTQAIKEINSSPVPSASVAASPKSTDPFSTWKTFSQAGFGYTLRYPNDWKVIETKTEENTELRLGGNGIDLTIINPLSGRGTEAWELANEKTLAIQSGQTVERMVGKTIESTSGLGDIYKAITTQDAPASKSLDVSAGNGGALSAADIELLDSIIKTINFTE